MPFKTLTAKFNTLPNNVKGGIVLMFLCFGDALLQGVGTSPWVQQYLSVVHQGK